MYSVEVLNSLNISTSSNCESGAEENDVNTILKRNITTTTEPGAAGADPRALYLTTHTR